MPIPANYFRFGYVLTARGNSGPRMVTISGNWVQPVGDPMEFGSNDWLDAALAWIRDSWVEDLRPAFHTTTSCIGGSISIADGGGTGAFTPSPGLRSGTLAPPQMAAIVQLRTTQLGRKGRGRMFMPDVLETDFDSNGIMGSGIDTIFSEPVLALIESMDNNVVPGEFIRGLNGAHILHADGSTPTRIAGVTVNQTPGWLRRRGR